MVVAAPVQQFEVAGMAADDLAGERESDSVPAMLADAGMTTDPTIAQLVTTGQGEVIVDMRTAEGTTEALGGLYPGSSLYMDCEWVAENKETVQKLANAMVRTLQFIDTHTAAEIAAEMPTEFNGGDRSSTRRRSRTA